jgi:hypothetical protein
MAGRTINPDGSEVATTRPSSPVPADRATVVAQIKNLLDLVPDAPDDDGSAIMARLLSADTWEDLNAQGSLPSAKDLAPAQLRVTGIVKRLSDLEGEDDATGIRLDHYLVVDAVDVNTGEAVRWQSSAPGVVLPLAKLHVWGKLPAVVRLYKAEKKTRRGFTPINLEVQAVG